MKLSDIRPNIETSGQFDEQLFSIEDTGMIFDILRNKMYSNPILAICREISSNARDAHREVGTPKRPVCIHLPNRLDPTYKVKDFGPGISPERMSNIFIKYTASTKRQDNIQTGGFGLGAKTPFSYSDTFTIITNVNGIQYNYACFIDETKVGKLALLSEAPTTEPNGTEIIIPVKLVDFKHFADWTEHATRHWDVKPLIKGDTLVYTNIEKTIEGNGWSIDATTGGYYNKDVKLIIDGIEYPLERAALKTYADSKMIDSSRGNIYLYFGVGELSLSASREQVYLDKPTQTKIKDRLDNMANEIRENIMNSIEALPSLWDANIYWHTVLTNAFSNIAFLGTLTWKGIPLSSSSIIVGCGTFTFSKGKYSRKHGMDNDKLTKSNSSGRISFDKSSTLFINDLPIKEPTPRHIKKAFDDDPKLKTIQIICPNDKVTEQVLNTTIHLDQMNVRHLSEITKASARAYTPASSRLIIYRFDYSACAFRQVSYANLDEDHNAKVIVMIEKDNYGSSKRCILKNGKTFSDVGLATLCKEFSNVSFIGIDKATPTTRIEEEFSDFQGFEEFLEEKISLTNKMNFVEIKFAKNHSYHIDDRQFAYFSYFKNRINNSESLFLKRLELFDKIKSLAVKDQMLAVFENLYGNISKEDYEEYVKQHPENNVDKINREYEEKYPLLVYLNQYNDYNKMYKHIAQYVNFMDAI